jgi:hypothetical protein
MNLKNRTGILAVDQARRTLLERELHPPSGVTASSVSQEEELELATDADYYTAMRLWVDEMAKRKPAGSYAWVPQQKPPGKATKLTEPDGRPWTPPPRYRKGGTVA